MQFVCEISNVTPLGITESIVLLYESKKLFVILLALIVI